MVNLDFKRFGLLALLFMCSFSLLQAQTPQRVSLDLKKASLIEVFSAIEKQTTYRFSYRNVVIDKIKNVTVLKKNSHVTSVLKEILPAKHLQFSIISEKSIVISEYRTKSQEVKGVKKNVTGKVLDEIGDPVIGATIVEKGNKLNGTVTDIDGNFTFDLSANATLTVSYIGYTAKDYPVNDKSNFVITLKEDTEMLDEVVVVGYGTQKKVNLTGAVATASSKDLQDKAMTNALEGLQGVIPNFNINYDGGSPSSTPDLNIRGYESINGGNPLVVIDGIQSDAYFLSKLNPEDIESISVLKDASSAAIYGSRAAFGVVLVTTKVGEKNEKISVDFTSNFIITTPTMLPEITNSYIHGAAVNEALRRAGDSPRFSDEHLESMRLYHEDPLNNPVDMSTPDGDYYYWGTIDYVDECLKKTSTRWRNNLNISGGTKIADYYISAGYTQDQGFLKYSNEEVDIFNIKAKLNFKITDWWTAGINTDFVKDKQSSPHSYNTNNWWDKIYGQRTYFPIKNPLNDYYTNNPIFHLKEGGRDQYEETNYSMSFDTKITPLKNWNIYGRYTFREYHINKTTIARDMVCSDNFGYRFPKDALWNVFTPSSVYQNNAVSQRNIFDVYSDYEKTIDKHYFKVLVGFNQDEYTRSAFNAEREEMINENVPSINVTTGEDYVGSEAYHWATRGAFYRVNYSFNDRYLLEASGRYDGSSRFPKESRFGFFPSFSGAWRISEEKFMDWSRGTIDNLKVRASYGSLGNQDVSTYAYIASMSSGKQSYLIGGDRPMGINPQGLVAADITWETVNTTNIGLDLGLFKNRLSATVDLYERKTLDMLTAGDAMPGILGASSPERNSADLSTKGWELSINWQDKIEEFSYGVGFVLSDSRTTITKYDNPTNTFSKDWYEGEEIGTIWGYETEGFIDTQEKLDKVNNDKTQDYFYSGTWKMGDIMYKDIDGDGKVDKGDNRLEDHGDLVKLGNSAVHYSFGVNLNASWRGISVAAFFQGVGKRDYMPSGYLFWPMSDTWRNIQPHQLDTWSEDNRDAYFPQMEGRATRNYNTQSKYMQSAAYIRLKNLSLSYTLPKGILQGTFIDNCRFTLSGRNLFEISSMIEPFDPENPSGMINPYKREYAIGLNINF